MDRIDQICLYRRPWGNGLGNLGPGSGTIMEKIRVFLALDHSLLRGVLRGVIQAEPDMEVAGTVADISRVPQEVSELQPPADVVITDALSAHNGISLVSQVRRESARTRVLLMVFSDDIALIRKLLDSGAVGCVGRHATELDVLKAIRQIHVGQTVIDPELAGNVLQHVLGVRYTVHEGHKARMPRQLSSRELEVMEYLVKGYTNQQIADVLFLSVKTTETYRARLKRKLGLRNRADIVRYGMEMGLLAISEGEATTQAT
jgi:two-component system response regulator NreC